MSETKKLNHSTSDIYILDVLLVYMVIWSILFGEYLFGVDIIK